MLSWKIPERPQKIDSEPRLPVLTVVLHRAFYGEKQSVQLVRSSQHLPLPAARSTFAVLIEDESTVSGSYSISMRLGSSLLGVQHVVCWKVTIFCMLPIPSRNGFQPLQLSQRVVSHRYHHVTTTTANLALLYIARRRFFCLAVISPVYVHAVAAFVCASMIKNQNQN